MTDSRSPTFDRALSLPCRAACKPTGCSPRFSNNIRIRNFYRSLHLSCIPVSTAEALSSSDHRALSESTVSFPEKGEVRGRRLSRALAQQGGSIEDQPFWAGIVVVSEVALPLKLQCLAMGIRDNRPLDEAAA